MLWSSSRAVLGGSAWRHGGNVAFGAAVLSHVLGLRGASFWMFFGERCSASLRIHVVDCTVYRVSGNASWC